MEPDEDDEMDNESYSAPSREFAEPAFASPANKHTTPLTRGEPVESTGHAHPSATWQAHAAEDNASVARWSKTSSHQVEFDCIAGPTRAENGVGLQWRPWPSAVATIKRAVADLGPYDGIWGYSIGALATGLLVHTLPAGTFRFCVLAAGYTDTYLKEQYQHVDEGSLDLPSLQIVGLADKIISNVRSAKQVAKPDASSRVVVYHAGAHLPAPKNTEAQNAFAQVIGFLQAQVKGTTLPGEIPLAPE